MLVWAHTSPATSSVAPCLAPIEGCNGYSSSPMVNGDRIRSNCIIARQIYASVLVGGGCGDNQQRQLMFRLLVLGLSQPSCFLVGRSYRLLSEMLPRIEQRCLRSQTHVTFRNVSSAFLSVLISSSSFDASGKRRTQNPTFADCSLNSRRLLNNRDIVPLFLILQDI